MRRGGNRRTLRNRCRRDPRFFPLRNRLQHIPGTGNVRKVNFRLDFFFAARRARRAFSGRSGTLCRAQVYAYFLCFVFFQGTGVRLLLSHADQGKRVENGFALDFQFSGKIVDANLTHPAFRFSAL
jgi:hypothetical protein